MFKNIKVIGFDADDTLWINEPYFRETEFQFADLLKGYASQENIFKKLFEIEVDNLELYGYGVKNFTISMIETAIEISNNKVNNNIIKKIIALSKEMLKKPVVLIENVEKVLAALQKNYRLIIATKGDLLDQERKLEKSGLTKYFHHIEILSYKETSDYQKLLKHLDIAPENFVMIGNSMKSDILPVVELGGYGIHIPFQTTWEHEMVTEPINSERIKDFEKIEEILECFKV